MDMTSRRDLCRLLGGLGLAVPAGGLLASCDDHDPRREREAMKSEGIRLASSDVQPSDGDPGAIAGVVAGMQRMGGRLLEALDVPGPNRMLSPYSIAVALSMTATGAAGATAGEMQRVLGAPEMTVFDSGLAALMQHLERLAGPTEDDEGRRRQILLATASSLFADVQTQWRRPFLDDLARYFGAPVRGVDFRQDAERARRLINAWTADRTHDRIPELLGPGTVDALTRLVLVNALYLRAPWADPFVPRATADHRFHLDDGAVVRVPMMRGSVYGYGAGPGWESVRLRYAGNDLEMTVVLPAAGRAAMVGRSLSTGGLAAMLRTDPTVEVDLTLPRWRHRTSASLQPVLERLGMRAAFTDAADFSRMSRPRTPEEALRIDQVVHETFVAVDEHGTEAAAATAVVMRVGSAPAPTLPRRVVVDRPFWFVIHDVRYGTPLFCGRVGDPRPA